MSNEEKKDTVLQEEANKVAEDAAKEKAEAVDAQAADEGAAQAEPDANDGADKPMRKKPQSLNSSSFACRLILPTIRSVLLPKSFRFRKSSKWMSSAGSCRSSTILNGL